MTMSRPGRRGGHPGWHMCRVLKEVEPAGLEKGGGMWLELYRKAPEVALWRSLK
jgi:hypothetical protein